MSSSLLLRNGAVWLGLFALAFANGAAREVGIKRVIPEPWAHHLSAVTAIVLFTAYISLIWEKTGIGQHSDAVGVGVFWFFLTLLTETLLLNRLMGKLSWEEILRSYDITQGHLWPLVLLWVGLLPLVILRLQGPSR